MLKIWNFDTMQTSADGPLNDYQVYQDDQSPDRFYAVPNQPTIESREVVAKDGKTIQKLSFQLLKFRGEGGSPGAAPRPGLPSGVLAGGYLSFTVVLLVPPKSKEDLKKQLQVKYAAKLKAAAAADAAADAAEQAEKKNTDTAQNDALSAATTRARARADATKKATDGVTAADYNDPATVDIKLSTIPFSDGDVSLNLNETNSAYFISSVAALAKPSKDGNNTAAFTLVLTPSGATFFEKACRDDSASPSSGGAGGPLQIFYSLKTWFRTSDTVVNVWFKKESALKYHQEIDKDVGSYSPGVCWREGSYKNEIKQTLKKHQVADCQITWNEGTYTTEQQDKLRQWGTDTLADMIKNQLKDLKLIDDQGDMGQGKTIRDFDFSVTEDISQTYSENFALATQLNPQGSLPKVPLQAADGDLYFKAIDLDDPFFQTRNIGVSIDVDFAKNDPGVTRVVVNLKYLDEERSFMFTAALDPAQPDKSGPSRKEWKPWLKFEDDAKTKPIYAYSYSYEIHYANKNVYTAGPFDNATAEELGLAEGTEGHVAVDAICDGFSDELSKVDVAVTAVSGTDRGPGKTITLTKDAPQQDVRLWVDDKYSSYEYQPTYTLADGTQIKGEAKVSKDQALTIPPPFSDHREIDIRAVKLTDGDTATVQLDYKETKDASPTYSRSKQLDLDHANSVKKWAFGVFDRAAGVLSYAGSFDLKDGTSREIPDSGPVRGDLIRLDPSRASEDEVPVNVDTQLVDWTNLLLLEVKLKYRTLPVKSLIFKPLTQPDGSKSGNVTTVDGHIVPADSAGPTYSLSFPIEAGDHQYQWQAIYHLKVDNKSQTVTSAWTANDDSSLLVPAADDAPTAA